MARLSSRERRSDLEALIYAQQPKQEILAFFGINFQTLESWCQDFYGKDFQSLYSQLAAVGRQQMRKKQLDLAERNPLVAEHVGRAYLKQLEESGEYTTTAYKANKYKPPYNTTEHFRQAVDEYIEYHERNNKIMTVNGLAYFLGYDAAIIKNWPCDNRARYGSLPDEIVLNPFYKTIQYALTRIAMQAEERAIKKGDSLRYLERLQPSCWQQVEEVKVNNVVTWGQYDKDL